MLPSGSLVDGLPLVANTGEDALGPAPLPYKCVVATPLIEICSQPFYRNDLASSQKFGMIISFHLMQVACLELHFVKSYGSAEVRQT